MPLQGEAVLQGEDGTSVPFCLLYDKIYRDDMLWPTPARWSRANWARRGGRDAIRDDRGDGVGGAARRDEKRPRREDAQADTGAEGDDPQALRRRAAARHPDDAGQGGSDRHQDRAEPIEPMPYADDFVILSRGRAVEALAWTKAVMTTLALTLDKTKTALRNARRGASGGRLVWQPIAFLSIHSCCTIVQNAKSNCLVGRRSRPAQAIVHLEEHVKRRRLWSTRSRPAFVRTACSKLQIVVIFGGAGLIPRHVEHEFQRETKSRAWSTSTFDRNHGRLVQTKLWLHCETPKTEKKYAEYLRKNIENNTCALCDKEFFISSHIGVS